MECKGFLFDLDGTLVDSLPAVERAWTHWAERHGIQSKEVLDFIHGKQAVTSLRHFMPGATEAEIQHEFELLEQAESQDTEGVNALPGALELLQRLDDMGIPWAIVTSGSVPVANARRIAGGLPKPEVFITSELVKHGKPQPDAYLLGAERLGFAPQACVVVEDAPAGILSGLAAGCQVIAVNAPVNAAKLDQVHLKLSSLTEINIVKIEQGARIELVA